MFNLFSKKPVPICVKCNYHNCKWGESYIVCEHPKLGYLDIVTGKTNYYSCEYNRTWSILDFSFKKYCGPKGYLFEPIGK